MRWPRAVCGEQCKSWRASTRIVLLEVALRWSVKVRDLGDSGPRDRGLAAGWSGDGPGGGGGAPSPVSRGAPSAHDARRVPSPAVPAPPDHPRRCRPAGSSIGPGGSVAAYVWLDSCEHRGCGTAGEPVVFCSSRVLGRPAPLAVRGGAALPAVSAERRTRRSPGGVGSSERERGGRAAGRAVPWRVEYAIRVGHRRQGARDGGGCMGGSGAGGRERGFERGLRGRGRARRSRTHFRAASISVRLLEERGVSASRLLHQSRPTAVRQGCCRVEPGISEFFWVDAGSAGAHLNWGNDGRRAPMHLRRVQARRTPASWCRSAWPCCSAMDCDPLQLSCRTRHDTRAGVDTRRCCSSAAPRTAGRAPRRRAAVHGKATAVDPFAHSGGGKGLGGGAESRL